MKKELDVKELTSVITNFTEQFGITAELGADFMWIPDKEIRFAVVEAESNNEVFEQFFKDNTDTVIPVFLWSLLHELGHQMTYDDLLEGEVKYSRQMKKLIENLSEDESDETLNGARKIYCYLPDELAASKWAIQFAEENFDYLKEWWEEELYPAIERFYEINDIKED